MHLEELAWMAFKASSQPETQDGFIEQTPGVFNYGQPGKIRVWWVSTGGRGVHVHKCLSVPGSDSTT